MMFLWCFKIYLMIFLIYDFEKKNSIILLIINNTKYLRVYKIKKI